MMISAVGEVYVKTYTLTNIIICSIRVFVYISERNFVISDTSDICISPNEICRKKVII